MRKEEKAGSPEVRVRVAKPVDDETGTVSTVVRDADALEDADCVELVGL